VEIPPKYAVSAIMDFLKGKLALKIFERFPPFGRKFWGRHLWSRGYGVSIVGLDEEMLRQYVRWQAKQEREDEEKQWVNKGLIHTARLTNDRLLVCYSSLFLPPKSASEKYE
jgi:hypothetical protein